jgi:hypothetical protein
MSKNTIIHSIIQESKQYKISNKLQTTLTNSALNMQLIMYILVNT